MHTEPNDQLLIQEQQASNCGACNVPSNSAGKASSCWKIRSARNSAYWSSANAPKIARDRGRKAAAQAADGVSVPEQQAQGGQQEPRTATSGWFSAASEKGR